MRPLKNNIIIKDMANITNSSQPTLGFIPGTTLGQYAGNLELAVDKMGGKNSKANKTKLDISKVMTTGRAINLAKDYILKGVSFGGIGDRIAGHLGLSTGGASTIKKTSLLGRTSDALFGIHYRKYGFPYRKDKLVTMGELNYKQGSDKVNEILQKESPSQVLLFNRSSSLYAGLEGFEKRKLNNNGTQGVSQVLLFNNSDLSTSIKALEREDIKNSKRRLSLVVFSNYPGGTEVDVLELPYVPAEFNWAPENNYVKIAAFGRNVPDYQYLGSSQEFSFDIDWYSDEGNYEKVVAMAKKVDSYSRSNAYKNNPPIVQLTGLYGYDKYYFYIRKAPYKVTEKSGKIGGGLTIYPRQIIQTVTLQRVATTNPKWETYEIENGNKS